MPDGYNPARPNRVVVDSSWPVGQFIGMPIITSRHVPDDIFGYVVDGKLLVRSYDVAWVRLSAWSARAAARRALWVRVKQSERRWFGV